MLHELQHEHNAHVAALESEYDLNSHARAHDKHDNELIMTPLTDKSCWREPTIQVNAYFSPHEQSRKSTVERIAKRMHG